LGKAIACRVWIIKEFLFMGSWPSIAIGARSALAQVCVRAVELKAGRDYLLFKRLMQWRNTMSDGPNRVFDEFAKLMTDAAGVAQGMRKEAETVFRSQAERMLNGLDLVKRDDFDAVREMAANAREENDKLTAKLNALEARLETLEGKKKTTAKPATRKTAKKA